MASSRQLTLYCCFVLCIAVRTTTAFAPLHSFLVRESWLSPSSMSSSSGPAVLGGIGSGEVLLVQASSAPVAQSTNSILLAVEAPTQIIDAVQSPSISVGSPGALFDSVVHNPVFWSTSVMLTIVGLLLLWEQFVEYARENTPKAILPVIENMLVEMGSLGFIGIVISVLLNRIALGETVGELSEQYLGERELLFESFEYLHEAFFQVGILFFTAAGIIVVRVLQKLNQITAIAEEQLGGTTGGDRSVAERLAGILNVYTLPSDCKIYFSDETGIAETMMTDDQCSLRDYEALCLVRQDMKVPFIKELTMSMEERGAETLTIRERLIQELDLPRTFRIDRYLENVFAKNKLEIVDLSPLSWLPIIPAIALSNALDLEHGVINAESLNAADTSGYFFSTYWVLFPTFALQFACFGWGALNFWKMAEIKSMLMPTLVRDAGSDCEVRLLPPAVENRALRAEFDSTPFLLKPLERYLGKPPENINSELFGDIGGNGPEVYMASIKFHTWLCVASIFFSASQILPRDLYAAFHMDSVVVGDPEHLIPEMLTYGALIALNALQLYFAPTTFLNYCLVTSVEDLKMEWAIAQSIEGWDGTPLKQRQ